MFNFEAGLSAFDSVNGDLTAVRGGAYEGVRSGRARAQSTGTARGVAEVAWKPREQRSYGAAFKLPASFGANVRDDVELLRWDTYGSQGSNGSLGGVAVGTDRRARVVTGKLSGGALRTVGKTFTLPQDRWFWLEVRQNLSAGEGALSEVYLDGKLVMRSTAPNSDGRGADRVRWGIVSTTERQSRRVELQVDRASWSKELRGPVSR